MEKTKIAIDGPAGSGKSSVAKIIAGQLNIEYIDSGAIYRAITKKILDSKLKIEDYKGINGLLDRLKIELIDRKVYINDDDMTPYIRTKEITEYVSPVSNNIDIRKKVNAFLNCYSGQKSVIMDGRDIGTVVFPDADYKFYVDASVDVRARRRFLEGNYQATLDEIKKNIEERDLNDKNKKFGALKKADDAVYIDTTLMTIDQVVQKILDYVGQ